MTWDGKEHRGNLSDGNAKMVIEALRAMHQDNKADIKELERRLDDIYSRLTLLPCAAHVEKFRRYDEHIEQGWKFRIALLPIVISLLGTMIAGIVTFSNVSHTLDSHIDWGKENLKFLEREIEKRCS